MKKIVTVLLLGLFLIACGKVEKKEETLYIFNWTQYIPQSIYDDFTKETGIKVVEDVFSSNEEMYAKIKAGATGYDILVPSQDYVEILKNDGLLIKIDKTKIETYKNISKVALEKLKSVDSQNDYAIPFAMGATGIIINKKYIKEEVKDFSIFQNEKNAGKMTMLDDMRQVMTSALIILGYKQDSTNPEELQKAKELILSWKKNIAKFDSESFGKGFANGEYYAVHGYTDNVYRELTDEQKKDTLFVIPKKGGLSYIDSFVIPKTSKNAEVAIKFIAYIHRPDVYAKLADEIGIPSINVEGAKLMKTSPVYEIVDLKDTSTIQDIGEALTIQQKYWEEILVSN